MNKTMIITSFQKRWTSIIVAGLAVLFAALSVTSFLRKSPTCDETGHHIASGYVFLTKGDFAFSTEVPPLSRYIMALPLLSLDLKMLDDKAFWAREDRSEFSREFIYGINREKAGSIVILSRITMVITGIFGGVFLFLWVKKHYGSLIATVSAALFFSSPNIIAHSSLATTDIMATVFIMCSVMYFWDFFEKPNTLRAIISGLLMALALLSKFTAIFLIPVYILITTAAHIRGYRKIGTIHPKNGLSLLFFVMLPAAFIFLWAGYLFEFRPLLDGVMRPEDKEVFFLEVVRRMFPGSAESFTQSARNFLYHVPVPLSSFMMGIAGIIRHSAEGSKNFFMGTWSDKGHPFYYIVTFFIKTPLPVIIGFLTGAVVILKDRTKAALNLYLLSFAVLFFVVASRSNLQLGLRYVLPAYPLIFVISALGISYLLKLGHMFKAVGVALLLWMAALHFFIWPDYLSYFNETIGGPERGYLYLRDSNIDWGQDLPALKKYMDENGIDEIKLAYFGTADPSYYGIKYGPIGGMDEALPKGSVYAVSVQYFDDEKWKRYGKPSALAGKSIFIYDMRETR